MNKILTYIYFVFLLFVICHSLSGIELDFFLLAIWLIFGNIFFRQIEREIKDILIVAFFIRLFAALISYTGIFPLEGSTKDALTFMNWGNSYSVLNYSEMLNYYFTQGGDFYSLIIGIVYRSLISSELLLILLNVLLSTFTVLFCYKIAFTLYGERVGRTAAWIISLIPYTIIFGVTITKEPLITFLLTSSVYYLLMFKHYKHFKHSLLSISSILLTVLLHGAMIVPLIIIGIMNLIFSIQGYNVRTNILGLIVISLSVLFFVIIFQSGVKIYKLGFLYQGPDLITELYRNSGLAIAQKSYRDHIPIYSYQDYFINLPSVVLPFLYQPYPWRIIELKRYILLFAGSGMWVIITFIFIKRWRLILTNKDSRYILILCGFLIITFAYGSSQLNQAIRHNHKIMPLMIASTSFAFWRILNRKNIIAPNHSMNNATKLT